MKNNDVLVLCKLSNDDTIKVSFFRVIRATSNTCEIRELKKEIVRQIGSIQEVVPRLSVFKDDPPKRCKIKDGQVIINDECMARLWDGESKWQAVTIHIPE
jgi:hypothetical protein